MKKLLVALLAGLMVFSAADAALARPRGTGGKLARTARQVQKQVQAKLEFLAPTDEQTADYLENVMKTWGEYFDSHPTDKANFDDAPTWGDKLDVLRDAAKAQFAAVNDKVRNGDIAGYELSDQALESDVVLAQVLCMTPEQMENLATLNQSEREILAKLPSDLQREVLKYNSKEARDAAKLEAAKANFDWDNLTADERTQLVSDWDAYIESELKSQELETYKKDRDEAIKNSLENMEKLANETGYSKSRYDEFMKWFAGNPVIVIDNKGFYGNPFDGNPVIVTGTRGYYAFMGRGFPTVRELEAAAAEAKEKGEEDKGVLFKDDNLIANNNGWELDHNADYLRLTLKEWDEAFIVSKGENVIKKDIDKMTGKGIPDSLVTFTYTNNYTDELVITPKPGVKGYITIGTLNDNSMADDDAIAGVDVYFDGSGESIKFSNESGLAPKHNSLQTYFHGSKMYDIRVIRGDVRLELKDDYINKNLTVASAPGFSSSFEAKLTSTVYTNNLTPERPGHADTDPRNPIAFTPLPNPETPLVGPEIVDDAIPLWDGIGDWMIPLSSLPLTGEGNLIAILWLGFAVSVITMGASAAALCRRNNA